MKKAIAIATNKLKVNRQILREKNDVHGDNKLRAMKPFKLRSVSAAKKL
jgi:hypothetical protein